MTANPLAVGPLLLTREQAAEQINLCVRTVDALIRKGELRAIREGRRVLVPRIAIEGWIRRKLADAEALAGMM
ncbi:MAG: excisionase family DNA-binding protein [Tepidisphaeraceae bacterium]